MQASRVRLIWAAPKGFPTNRERRRGSMKSLGSRIAIVMVVLSLAAAAYAAGASHKGTFKISDPVQVSGKSLPAGEYVIKWDGTGPDVQATISQGSKVVATVLAKVVELQQKSTSSTAEVANGASGNGTLSQVQFSGQKYALEFSGAADGAGASGSSIR
jgi:hypothetical protein